MANFRRSNNSSLFRIIVTPAVLLCIIFRKPVFQWIAVTALAVWLGIVLVSALKQSGSRRKSRKAAKKLAELSSDADTDSQPETSMAESDLFLIRQINIRITEQLKSTYPMVSWLWIRRPATEEICAGGTWRISTTNTDPFNYGEVSLSKTGRLTITMLQATPLEEASELAESDELTPSEMLDRVDVKAWYVREGSQMLSSMIDDLNTQGHRKLMIRENGEVCIEASGELRAVDLVSNFPPRAVWEEFCQLLKEDEITAAAQPEGLLLSW